MRGVAVIAILVYESGRTQHIQGFPDPPPLTWSWRPDPDVDRVATRFRLARVDGAAGIAWYEEAPSDEASWEMSGS